MKTVAVLQPNYIPWKGYFDIIHDVDTFVFYDDVKYTKNDWRNRNIIRGPKGSFWLTIPVIKSATSLPINQVVITDSRWQKKHKLAFSASYAKSQFFNEYSDFLKDIYETRSWKNLSDLNEYIITIVSDFLGIKVEFRRSSEFELQGIRQDRLLDLLNQIGAKIYISGPSGQQYIDERLFESEGIKLVYKNYSYPEYSQLWQGDFNHNVSILDLLFNTGEEAPYYIWGWRNGCKS